MKLLLAIFVCLFPVLLFIGGLALAMLMVGIIDELNIKPVVRWINAKIRKWFGGGE